MRTNQSLEHRRDTAVAKAIAYSATFVADRAENAEVWDVEGCLLYTSPSPRDVEESRMPSSA